MERPNNPRDERTKNFIFQGLNIQSSDVCFVQYNETLNEIMFCYRSGDAHAAFERQQVQ